MLRLDMSAEPRWLDLALGVRVRVAPCTSSLMARARGAETIEALVAAGASPADLSIALAKEIALMAILAWEGIGDAEGNPIAPGSETIPALMDVYPIFEAFQLGYVAKGLMLDSEKNGSAPSPTGTSAAAEPIARPARRAARPARRG